MEYHPRRIPRRAFERIRQYFIKAAHPHNFCLIARRFESLDNPMDILSNLLKCR
jgi:hypothetical protein